VNRSRLISAALATVCVVAAMFVNGMSAQAATTRTVQSTPVSTTPWLLKSTPNQYVRELVPCGSRMYAVGTISAIGQGSHTYTRGNAFSFSATSGALTGWDPRVNGTVNSIAFSPDCATAYLGGRFTQVHGVAAANIVAVDTVTGAVRTGFAHSAAGEVFTVQYTHGRLLAGGTFTWMNGVQRTRFASMTPDAGAVGAYAKLTLAGDYSNITGRVYNSQLSHDGTRMLIEGVFTSINGIARRQVAVLDLGTRATLDGWNAPELNRACSASEAFFARAANWSPEDRSIYIATTGYLTRSGPGSTTTGPRAGLCDAVAAFPATASAVSSKWINYTGCDSLYAVAADTDNVYVSGHERWANNPDGCDAAGPGAVSRPGLASINPSTGLATAWNPTRSLGHGGDDLTLTSAGLWVASDNWLDGNAQQCGGVTNHGGICFLPY
jgi:hypothetical protein